jgi:ribosome-binding protein aMBF1 (putative translation factor)
VAQQPIPTRAQLFLAAVGERVMTYRETAGLSLDDLSDEVGVSAEDLDRFEHGWLDLPLTTLQAIADALGVTVAELLDVASTELGLPFGEH